MQYREDKSGNRLSALGLGCMRFSRDKAETERMVLTAIELFKKSNPNLTPADWAFWWLWNQPEITVVLSGMNSSHILKSNLRSVENYKPLTENELAVYTDVVALFRKSYKINCTGCNYCLPCPKGINIPACFSAYNASYLYSYNKGLHLYNTELGFTENPKNPRLCSECGKCEKVCPQNLPIRKNLKKVAERFDRLPLRLGRALLRRITAR